MKLTGYRHFSTWYLNHCEKKIHSSSGRLLLCGNAVYDLEENAKVTLYDDLILGANLRKGSKAESYLKIKKNGRLDIKGRFQVFFGASLEVFPNGCLTLGKGYINTGGAIACAKSITIGDGVFIGRNTYITDSDHHAILNENGIILNEPKPVNIGNHVLIGFGAVVLKGVTIGDGAIIAAGAVVTRDVPPNCLAAGIPAEVVKEKVIWQ